MFDKLRRLCKDFDNTMDWAKEQREIQAQYPCSQLTISDDSQLECTLVQKLKRRQEDLARAEKDLSHLKEQNPDELLPNTMGFILDAAGVVIALRDKYRQFCGRQTFELPVENSYMRNTILREICDNIHITRNMFDVMSDELNTFIAYDEVLTQKQRAVSDLRKEIDAIKQELGIW